jgi:phage portal protein BeeE
MQPRRHRQARALYSRAGSNDLRINVPTILVPFDAEDPDYPSEGGWHYGDGGGITPGTVGSPMTEPTRIAQQESSRSLLPAVTRCTRVLTGAVIRTRWFYQDRNGLNVPRPKWIESPMMMEPMPGPAMPVMPIAHRLGKHEFFEQLLSDAILFGQGAFAYAHGSDGAPLAGSCIPLNPYAVADAGDGRWIVGLGDSTITTDFDGHFEMNGQSWGVSVLRGDPPYHGVPQGVLARHWPTFRIGARVTTYMSSLFRSGVPSGYLQVSTPNFGVQVDDPENPGTLIWEQDLLKRQWYRAVGRGERETAVLNASVAYTPISISPVDAQAVEAARDNRIAVAHAFGMSSVWLDEGASGLTYSNSSERRADLVSMTAASWGERITDLVSALTPGVTAQVAWSTFVSPSMETVLPTLVQAVQTGILTAGEARQIIGWEPWQGADPAWQDVSKATGGGGDEVAPDAQ